MQLRIARNGAIEMTDLFVNSDITVYIIYLYTLFTSCFGPAENVCIIFSATLMMKKQVTEIIGFRQCGL